MSFNRGDIVVVGNVGEKVSYLKDSCLLVKDEPFVKVGDYVKVIWEFDAGIEGIVEAVTDSKTVPVSIKVTKDPRHNKWVGTTLRYNFDDVKVVEQPRGIKPGDRVRVRNGSPWRGCEGTVTYSIGYNGHPVVLITSDPVSVEGGLVTDVGHRLALPVNELEVIAKPVVQTTQTGPDNYSVVLDHIAPYV